LQRGLREHEIQIRREEQLLNNKRTDFIICMVLLDKFW